MTKRIEGTADEIIEMLTNADVDNNDEDLEPQADSLQESILTSAVHTFIQMMNHFIKLGDGEREECMRAVLAYQSPEIDPLSKIAAFSAIHNYLFGEVVERKEPSSSQLDITRCESSNTPCEECDNDSKNPVHRIKFSNNNRIEEHFLCEVCEHSARSE